MLEKESGLYFNVKNFKHAVFSSDWDEAESYLSAFVKLDDSPHSTKIFFKIRKLKASDALDRGDKKLALEILGNDLRILEASSPQLYKEMTQLIPLKNFRPDFENVNSEGRDRRRMKKRSLFACENVV